MREFGWKMLEGAMKVAPVLGFVLALATSVLLIGLAVIGAWTIADGGWDWSW